ncbi:type II secretion system F family protein [Halodesulfurarchaeum sp. HSR-GB]|uniref:type II secretion system F family protein n=1 Tax=Halodesulfurarchaeum sp. HSR-GB TaxID=3074077 RepID=UPI00285E891C|nr:type II secretion system F family protein [Halodesulfurarchaeum sp. HSR-GB]MDR5657440.1 type II secretion system F family protein [Halodesulfurarchaeum sp. HSR-GB]
MLELLPLGLIAVLLVGLALVPVSSRLDRVVTRVALATFGEYVGERRAANTRQVGLLAAAHRPATYRAYAAKTFLYATIAALLGSVAGVYGFLGTREALVALGLPSLLPWLSGLLQTPPAEMGIVGLFGLLLGSSATLGVIGAFGTYRLRWYLPQYEAGERARRIDSTLKRNVAFLFALSRSGMPFTQVLRTLSNHATVYGETAREFAVTVKDIDLLGADLITGVERTNKRTPSDELSEFAENLASVLRSGGSLTGFLQEQYEYFREEESAQQERFIELLGVLAEAYVTVFVAGMLFLITILVVVGLLLGGTLTFLHALVYLVLGLANIGFIVYLDTITEDLVDADADDTSGATELQFPDVPVESATAPADETETKNRDRLSIARQIRPILRSLMNPRRLLTERPAAILWVTVPIALLWVIGGWWPALSTGTLTPSALDDPLIRATLFVTGTYAITYEIGHRRVKRIEAAIPDFLDRLAATNEAGMSLVESFGRVARSDLGALSTEMQRTWADVQTGAPMERALRRFQARVQTPAITRVVTLTTNAMGATNDIGPVLRIAADEAKSARRLERDRHNELLTYVVVIYVAFFVFLGIVLALDQVFIPSIPTGLETGGAAGGVGFGGSLGELTPAKKEAYGLVFFHAGIIQGYVSGFVAGQMSDGRLAAGAKHATAMLAIAYVVFLVFA